MRMNAWLCVALSFILAGCVVGPNYRRPTVSTPSTLPGQAAGEIDSLADRAWWDLFPDLPLGELIKEALANNDDLLAAIARVQEAQDLIMVARSDYYPQVGYGLGVQKDRGVYKLIPELALPSGPAQNLFLGGLSTAWEADVWGRIRRSNQAALAAFIATEQGRRALRLSLVSDITQAYFELQELDRRLTIARSSTNAFQSTYTLFSERYGAGITSRLAVTRAESALAGRGRNRIAQNPTPQVIDSNMQDLMDLTTKALLPQAVSGGYRQCSGR